MKWHNYFYWILIGIQIYVYPNTNQAKKLFDEGNLLYKSKNYNLAIQKYNQIENLGLQSPENYMNLGNCYFNLNQLGQAIYNYHRALKIDPTLDTAYDTLEIANTKTKDQINNSEQLSLIDAYLYFLKKTSNLYFVLLGFILSSCTVFLYHKHKTFQNKWFVFSGSLTIILLISLVFNFINLQKKIGVIVLPEVQVYNDVSLSKEIRKLHTGTTFTVNNVKNDVAEIMLSTNATYFIPIDNIKIVD